MTDIVGVKFRESGKVYYFDPLNMDIKQNDHVIVETSRGLEYGLAVNGVISMEESRIKKPLKGVIRIASPEDDRTNEENKKKEKDAFGICLEKIKDHGLDMKLIDVRYTFDGSKVLFYFTADGRVDFRELVKDLATVFRTRIELRQIGVRDESKTIGSIGMCGRSLCCSEFLDDFVSVSVKMAKEQGLSLNPTKISGACGRLMCCLKYEEDAYEELNKRSPQQGESVKTPYGPGVVRSVRLLKETVMVELFAEDEKTLKEVPVSDIQRG